MNNGSTKPVIGMIGSIGAGKSAVATMLAERGGLLIDADKLGHEALEQPGVKASIVRRWGNGVLKSDGTVNRRAIGGIVFASETERQGLEAMVFPAIARMVWERIDTARLDSRVRFIVLDAPVLIEAGWKERCNRLLFVDAPREMRLARVSRRNGWTEVELMTRENAQMPIEEKRNLADAAIVNDGTLEELRDNVESVLNAWDLIETINKDDQCLKK